MKKRLLTLLLICTLLCSCLCGCAPDKKDKITGFESLSNAKIGLVTGTIFEGEIKSQFPNADRVYSDYYTNLLMALRQGKLDAFAVDETIYTALRWEVDDVVCLDQPVMELECGFPVSEDFIDRGILDELNQFIKDSRQKGLTDQLEDKWFGEKEPEDIIDYSDLPAPNGILKIAVDPTLKPVTYVKDTVITGFDIDYLYNFCKEYGYGMEVISVKFGGIIPGIQTNKFDFACGNIFKSEERMASVTFSDTYCVSRGSLIVLADRYVSADSSDINSTGEQENSSLIEKIKSSFEKTFIKENRWKLILDGVYVTIIITIASLIFGTLLGFGIYLCYRKNPKITSRIASVYSRILAGTPIVVILMILYYIILGDLKISGITVAIIGFTMTLSAFVYDKLVVIVNGIDKGQTEAALALGYTSKRTFFRIILPQACRQFIPLYRSEAVSLLKGTAIVGYIAVEDLTKMGDIIRSSTYEAFFPLISTAVIYFVLTWILSILINQINNRFDSRKRSKDKILKGVKPE